jgi:enterochelin esterase-like enzyme
MTAILMTMPTTMRVSPKYFFTLCRERSGLYACFIMVMVAVFASGCDPLAAETRPLIIQVTATPPPPTRAPTTTPIPSDTATPPPATATPRPTAFVCNEVAGRLVDDTFKSAVSGQTVKYRVYLPPCYWQTARRYPVVVLMHGSDTDQTFWTDDLRANTALDAGIRSGTLPPMILVMPGGDIIANTNVFRSKSYEMLLLNELVPLVDRSLCTWGTRAGRAIGGISRGGFWAFLVAFRHPDLFNAVGGHSPFFDSGNAPPDYNPLNLAQTVKFPAQLQPRIWIDAGKDDYARPNIEVFRTSLEARNIDPGYTMYPTGQHTASYWASHVSEYLDFYGKDWPRQVEALPSCLP